ncbi:MAG: hypothetical protein HRU17_03160 [Polyangiaceae bacterium]|nr:hypothetical protein [Polyangiaceae bacterium]
MPDVSAVLIASAAGLGAFHTLVGVDHFLPFVLIAKARDWSVRKTLGVTAACGIAHVLSSVLLGTVGIALGMAADRMALWEGYRGDLAGWLLIAFGTVYAVWGFRHGRDKAHRHAHVHQDGTVHSHAHDHRHPGGERIVHAVHNHSAAKPSHLPTTGALFVIFALGPCEALIPLLIGPAFERQYATIALVMLAFGVATLGIMLTMVALGIRAAHALPKLQGLERYAHGLAGIGIAFSGLSVRWLGI